MAEKRNELYPVITQDHDGTWSWTIESGTALENTRRVHAVNGGYDTQGDARAAAKARLAELVAERSAAAGAAPDETAPTAARSTPAKATEANESAGSAAAPLPDWGVYAGGSLVALFADKRLAETFGKTQYGNKHSVKRVRYNVVPGK
ncbi:MAG TPA: hypothetical protein VFX89_03885 [Gammaproteobacteria bacterium]|nr:hypothetical protein [Gammaproteobacteria bacterium]